MWRLVERSETVLIERSTSTTIVGSIVDGKQTSHDQEIAMTTSVTPGTWILDPAHSDIGFSVRHLMSKVRGSFTAFEGTLVTAEDLTASSVNVVVDLASIDTGTPDRDAHLQSSDIFDVASHPKMTFQSTAVQQKSDNQFAVSGDLTIKGITHPLELAVEFLGEALDQAGVLRVGVEATGQLSRKDYGIDFNVPAQGDKVVIGDTINLLINAQAVLEA